MAKRAVDIHILPLLCLVVIGAAALAGAAPAHAFAQQSESEVRYERLAPEDRQTLDSLRAQIQELTLALERVEGQRPVAAARADSTAEQALRATAEGLQWVGLRSLWAVVVLVLTFLFVKLGAGILDFLAERSATRRLFYKRLIPILRVVFWAVAVYYIVAVVFDIDRRGLLAAAAAIGVAVGFAAQDVLKNIFGGIILIFDQPFQVGDKISVGGTYGEVVSIGLRSTRIQTPDDNLVTVPNAQAADSQVSNANAGALTCQVVVDLYLPGWVDLVRAKEIAYQAAVNSRFTYLYKPIKVLVRDDFKTTFLTHLRVKAYVLDTRYEADLASDVTEAAKAAFMQEGMLVPMTGVGFMPTQELMGNGEND